jgi:hypothetical protein
MFRQEPETPARWQKMTKLDQLAALQFLPKETAAE